MEQKLNLGMLESDIRLADAINNIMKSTSLKVGVKDICEKYTNKLKNGEKEELIYESFIDEMNKLSSNSSIDKELNILRFNAKMHKNNIDIKNAVYEMQNSDDYVISNMVESKVANYLVSKNEESAKELRESLQIFRGRANVEKILECVTLDEYTKKINGKVDKSFLNESAVSPKEVLYTKEQMEDIVKQKVDEAVENERKNAAPKITKMSQLEDRIQMQASIDNLLQKEGRNKDLKNFCESYLNALRNGASQYALYESYISGLSQYSFLNAVDTEMSAMKERVSKYKQEIDLTKILEAMKQSTSYYIVPIIEECIVNYCNNKNAANRVMARQACDAFMYDPFVKDIMTIIGTDRSIENLYLGESFTGLRNYARTEKIYSPVLYIKENETVFNVDGVFYSKKGNNVSRVPKGEVMNLSESFRGACKAVNSSNVEYDELEDGFRVYSNNGKDYALVKEGKISVNGKETSYNTISNHNFMLVSDHEGNGEFYRIIKSLYENFNIIAEIDFAKRVRLNESNKCVDVFKLNKTIHMALVNEDKTTEFYKDVNPIRCKNLMNEHMNYCVDSLFENELPNAKKMEEEINNTKESYENYIGRIKKGLEQLESLEESGDDSLDKEGVSEAKKVLEKELEDIESDYKKYQDEVEKELNNAEDEKNKEDKEEKSDDIEDIEPESPEELSEPLTGDSEEPVDANNTDEIGEPESEDDMFNGIENDEPSEYDGLLDTPATTSDEFDKEFEVIKVSFDKNIKSGKTSNKGSVIMTIPMVNPNGDVKDEIKTVTFIVGENKEVIINNENMMTVTMYNTIKNAIVASHDIEEIEYTETPDTEEPESTPVSTEFTSIVTNVDTPAEIDSTDSIEDTEDGDKLSIDSIIDPIDSLNTETDNDLNSIDNAIEQTPAEVEEVSLSRSKDEGYINVSFPIEIGLAYKEILPIDGQQFIDDIKSKNIAYREVTDKELGDGIVITVKNRAEIEYIQKYFQKWLEIDRHSFFEAFPELKQFESFNYKKANKLYESLICEGNIEIDINNADEDFIDAIEDEDIRYDEGKNGLVLIANNVDEFDMICNFLDSYKNQIDENDELVKEIETIIGEISPNNMEVILPYDGKLTQKLDKLGIEYKEEDENVVVNLDNEDDAESVLDIADELDIDEPSVDELRDFMEDGGFVSEGIKITFEDTETNQKVTLDTDVLTGKKSEDKEEEEKKSEDEEGDATFNDEDTQLYNTKEEAESASDKKEEEQKECDMPKKKKFVFKAKKLHESAQVKYAQPHVGDKVYYKNNIGTITSKYADDRFVIIVKGETIVCDASEVKSVCPKLDCVDDPNDKIITKLK